MDDDDLAMCTRCEDMVDSETLMEIANWYVCEICWDDL
jgi:hypothetical protein